MAEVKGQKVVISKWVTGAPGSYKVLSAVVDMSIEQSAEEIDTTSKSTGGYRSSIQGRKDTTINLSGIAEFSPAGTELGFADIKDDYNTGTEWQFKISEVGGTSYTSEYGTCWWNSLNVEMNDGDVVKWSGSLRVIGGMTETDPNA